MRVKVWGYIKEQVTMVLEIPDEEFHRVFQHGADAADRIRDALTDNEGQNIEVETIDIQPEGWAVIDEEKHNAAENVTGGMGAAG